MNSDIIHTEGKWKKGDARILIIDKLLSRGWTSYFDMNVALFRELNGETKTIAKLDDKGLQEYCFEHQEYTNNIKVSDIPHMIDVWALIRRGVDIEGILEREKKNGRKVSENPIRDEMRQNFIEVHKIDPDNEEELTEHNLSDATLYYLKKGNTNGQSILVFRYKEQGYSIREDLLNYNKEQNTTRFSRNIDSGITYDMSDIGKYNLIPDPDVIARKRRALLIEALQDKLIRDTTGAVRRRLESISALMESRTKGWMEDVSNRYQNMIYDADGILKGIDLEIIKYHYSIHLTNNKDYQQAEIFLNKCCEFLREEMVSDNCESQERYAWALQNLSVLHKFLGKYSLAEKEAVESLEIFSSLAKTDDSYRIGMAFLLETLAGIHIDMRKLGDDVEEDLISAINILSQLPQEKFFENYITLTECYTTLADYYQHVDKLEDSIRLSEENLQNWKLLVDVNFELYAPRYSVALGCYSYALQKCGNFDRAEELLIEDLNILNKLDENNPGVYKIELATTYNNLGSILFLKGDENQAKEKLFLAESLARDLTGRDPNVFKQNLAGFLELQTNLYFETKDFHTAISKGKEALSLLYNNSEEGKNEMNYRIGDICSCIGKAYTWLGDPENALLYLNKAELTFRPFFDKDSAPTMCEVDYAETLLYLGELYDFSFDGKSNEAEAKYKESLDVALWISSHFPKANLDLLVRIYSFYGLNLAKRGCLNKAKQMWRKALQYWESERCQSTDEVQQLVDMVYQCLQKTDDR